MTGRFILTGRKGSKSPKQQRMLSAASGPLSGRATALPGAPSMCLSNGDFVLAGTHIFSFGVAITLASQPCQCEVTDAEHCDHVIVCKLTAGIAILRHDI